MESVQIAGATMSGADSLNTMAFDFMLAGDYPKATYWLRRALDMDRKNPHARNNLATCLKQLGREPEAIREYEQLVADQPDFLFAVNNLAFSLLRAGRYTEAWQRYHGRRAAHMKIVTITNPVTGQPFLGEPLPTLDELEGKDVLIALEQGIGDELFFLRFVPKLLELARPRAVWYAPGLKLYPLLTRIPSGLSLTDSSFCLVPKDNAVGVPIGDLPLLCGHDGTWFPPSLRLPYTLPEPTGPVGVTWRAGDASLVHKGGTSKQVPPEALGKALRGVPVVVMQRNPTAEEIDAFRAGYGGDFEVYERSHQPVEELMALIDQLASLSGYVGVSNTDIHLLALIGRTARVLVIHPAEWRWFDARTAESPWFPGFQRYHADVLGWDRALARLTADLVA